MRARRQIPLESIFHRPTTRQHFYVFDAIRNTVGDQEPGFNQHGTGHWLEGHDHEHLFGNGANCLGAFQRA